MMEMASPAVGDTRHVEVYENERYSPVTGWSSRGLLLTDRGVYSSEDGNVSFATLDEASDQLISIGWAWDGSWNRDMNRYNTDDHGWTYSADFAGFNGEGSGAGVKSMIHFVRRRRYLRKQVFDTDRICILENPTCNYCDLEEIERLSSLLLEKLTIASLKKHPRYINIVKINVLKDSIITTLHLHTNTSNPLTSSYSCQAVTDVLEAMIHHGANSWSMASAATVSGGVNSPEYFAQRASDISREFSLFERNELAKLIIRKYDREFEYHCKEASCSSECPFSRLVCPNTDCGFITSRVWMSRHDSVCPQKIVDCKRICGQRVVRRLMDEHLATTCELRPTPCPFNAIGCATACTVRSLPDHMENFVQSHLLLTLARMDEQQKVIVSLHRRCSELEGQLASVDHKHTTASAALAATMAAAEVAEKRSFKHVTDELSKLESKAARHASEAAAELRGEVTKLKRAISDLTPKK